VACVSGCGVCTGCCAVAVHTSQLETQRPQHCITYNDVSLLINSTKV